MLQALCSWPFAHYKAQSGTAAKIKRFFGSWFVLFSSKLVILEVIDIAFGKSVEFDGPMHGLMAFIVVVVVAIIVAEQVSMRLYRALG